jgi:hypothetical protein
MITVKEACDGLVIDLGLVVKDWEGNIIKQTTAGNQVSIEGTITFDCFQDHDYSQSMLFEVRDADGTASYPVWQMSSASQDLEGQIMARTSWAPENPGKYEVRFFAPVYPSCQLVLSHDLRNHGRLADSYSESCCLPYKQARRRSTAARHEIGPAKVH